MTTTIMGLKTATPIQYPTGRWGLVGMVPIHLLYTMADGSPLTKDVVAGIKHCGTGLYSKTIKSVTFDSESAALAAYETTSR